MGLVAITTNNDTNNVKAVQLKQCVGLAIGEGTNNSVIIYNVY